MLGPLCPCGRWEARRGSWLGVNQLSPVDGGPRVLEPLLHLPGRRWQKPELTGSGLVRGFLGGGRPPAPLS